MKNRTIVPDPDLLRLVAEYEAARDCWRRVAWTSTRFSNRLTYMEADLFNDATRALALALGPGRQIVVDEWTYRVTVTGINRIRTRKRVNK